MNKKFRSKIGLELIIFLTVVLSFSFYGSGFDTEGLLVLLALISFFAYFFLSISYSIKGNVLIINNILFLKTNINISDIYKIEESNNPLSSPAASLDRLLVRYGNSDAVLISPANRDEFLKDLMKVNPNIEIKLKDKPTIFSKLAL